MQPDDEKLDGLTEEEKAFFEDVTNPPSFEELMASSPEFKREWEQTMAKVMLKFYKTTSL